MKPWDDVQNRLHQLVKRAVAAELAANCISGDAACRPQAVPQAALALPRVVAGLAAMEAAVGVLEAALPLACSHCGERGGQPAGCDGRCTLCVRWCEECREVELTVYGDDYCARCAAAMRDPDKEAREAWQAMTGGHP